ncbi:hypothetical protein [Flagellimonas okinawensis]|uniref:DUF4890 domain-containing protein n=1 Tax=Flagellimonas okinawensis TaxID=3031324 RepID=A0ABT5XTJ5_9FLAO|nr:hypothetical protein [[Muricauda] okinawensis]MDF0709107.1 hypothetical protein [[Muricauda] okinawensis]
MKRFAVVLVMLMSIGMAAQRNDGHRARKGPNMDMTAEQTATLRTKHMTLALDLTEAQQDKVYEINLENAQLRQAKWDALKAQKESGEWKRPTTEQRFEMENARLNRQIAVQGKMKKVLNPEQYETWLELQKSRKAMHGKKKMEERGRRR